MDQDVKFDRRPAVFALAGALIAVSVCSAPIAGMSGVAAAAQGSHAKATGVVPIPVQVSKGVQQLVKLVPELSKRYVVYGGDVDGPGVSGVTVSFANSAADKESRDHAIFNPQTGSLLALNLEPKTVAKPIVLSDQQARTKAVAFVAGLQAAGNAYQAREVVREGGLTTVRLVRKLNNVVLDDEYDCFVTFDGAGRLIGFLTFNGSLHEKISAASLPSVQRVLSLQQANTRYQQSRPLELVYMLPEMMNETKPTEAKLTYVVRDGVIGQSYTGSALDALTGKRLIEQANVPKQLTQTISISGTSENWSALTETDARDMVRMLFHIEPGKLPLATFVEKRDNGQERRFFIWGGFRPEATDQDKQYEIGQFPANVTGKDRRHILLETDGKTGQLIRFVTKDGSEGDANTNKKRDWQMAETLLKRLLPAGTNQMRMQDVGNERYTLITADPVVNGIPVYRQGQREEEGMYTLLLNARTGTVEELTLAKPANMVVPPRSKAINEQAAIKQLLKAFPLELTYIHSKNPQTGAVTWKLGYDLSFRQTRAHCFCGGPGKVDLTVHVDAVTGKVIVKE